MQLLSNPHRGKGLADLDHGGVWPSVDAGAVSALLAQCPAFAPTPLLASEALAREAGVARFHVKDERGRMGLGSFKALGAAYVIARDAVATGAPVLSTALKGRVYAAASAGNHGLSVAAGAKVFGATAIIFLSESVPEAFAERLRAKGARVERAGHIYEESMAAAAQASERNGWTLLSDSSWPGYLEIPFRVMEGYLQMSAEAASALDEAPTHIFLQAGVGGLAAAVAAHARSVWGKAPHIAVVEPEFAQALIGSIRAGRMAKTDGPVSSMGRLDCKEPSLIALAGLARDADSFITISEEEAVRTVESLSALGIDTTPSGSAGIAGALNAGPHAHALGLGPKSRILTFLSEGAEAP
ncbi:MAG: pyridoxal-phosphate dependent enzyme [Parvibaculaceae bacterium]